MHNQFVLVIHHFWEDISFAFEDTNGLGVHNNLKSFVTSKSVPFLKVP